MLINLIILRPHKNADKFTMFTGSGEIIIIRKSKKTIFLALQEQGITFTYVLD
jgi:hypothetical protein